MMLPAFAAVVASVASSAAGVQESYGFAFTDATLGFPALERVASGTLVLMPAPDYVFELRDRRGSARHGRSGLPSGERQA